MMGLAAAAVSGLLYYLSTNLGTYWPLAWIAPAPALWYALGPAPGVRVLPVAFAAFLAGEISLIPVYSTVVPVAALVVALAVPAAAFAAAVLVAGRLGRFLPPATGVLLFPALWTAWEYVFSLVSPNGTFLSVAYSQVPFPALIQIAGVAGMAAITFLVSLVPSGLALALKMRPFRPSYILFPAFVLIAALGFGIASLLRVDNTPEARVGLIARNSNRRGYGTNERRVAVDVAAAYARAVDSMAPQGAEVVLLPEACVTLRPEWATDVRALFAGVASRNHVQMVIGFDEYLADGTHRNVAEVISQSGTYAGRYVKQRHLPGQDYQAGKEILVLPGGAGVSICKDLDFPSLGRRYSIAGTGLMMVPAWDFGKDARLHAQMAWLRGVEGGYSVVRCAEEGLLSVTDSKGIPVAITESRGESEVLLAASVRLGPGNTIYARTGEIFAIACVLASAAMAGFAVLRRRRRERKQCC